MKYLALSLMPAVALALLAASAKPGEPARPGDSGDSLDKLVKELLDPDLQRFLRSGSVIAGNIVVGEKWYALGASEIAAARSILKHKKPWYHQGELVPLLPEYRVVLWGVAEGKVVPAGGLMVAPSVQAYVPLGAKTLDKFLIADGKDRDCLRGLIKRIEDGKQESIPVERKLPLEPDGKGILKGGGSVAPNGKKSKG